MSQISGDGVLCPQNSRNVALEAYLIKPHSYVGLTCTAFQRREGGMLAAQPGGPGQDVPLEPEPLAEDQQLRFRCTTGRPNISLSSFHIKVGTRGREGGVGAGARS